MEGMLNASLNQEAQQALRLPEQELPVPKVTAAFEGLPQFAPRTPATAGRTMRLGNLAVQARPVLRPVLVPDRIHLLTKSLRDYLGPSPERSKCFEL